MKILFFILFSTCVISSLAAVEMHVDVHGWAVTGQLNETLPDHIDVRLKCKFCSNDMDEYIPKCFMRQSSVLSSVPWRSHSLTEPVRFDMSFPENPIKFYEAYCSIHRTDGSWNGGSYLFPHDFLPSSFLHQRRKNFYSMYSGVIVGYMIFSTSSQNIHNIPI